MWIILLLERTNNKNIYFFNCYLLKPENTNLSGSSGSLCCFNSSLPRMTGADRPGHSILIFPTPIICPRFKSRIRIRPAPLPRPFLAPALLTEVTDFHNFSAGTVRTKTVLNTTYYKKHT